MAAANGIGYFYFLHIHLSLKNSNENLVMKSEKILEILNNDKYITKMLRRVASRNSSLATCDFCDCYSKNKKSPNSRKRNSPSPEGNISFRFWITSDSNIKYLLSILFSHFSASVFNLWIGLHFKSTWLKLPTIQSRTR